LKKIIILLIPFILKSFFLELEIHETQEFKEVAHIFETPDPQTLFVFDIDDTLIINPSYGARKKTPHYHNIKSFLKALRTFSRVVHEAPYVIIDPLILDLILSLHHKGIKMLALSHCITGSFGMGSDIIPSVPRWRYEKLKDSGIDFSSSFENQEITFEYTMKMKTFHPLYYKGILFTDYVCKGSMLGKFLETIRWKPSNVIFFDDKLTNLQAVQMAMHAKNIPFQGFLYKGPLHEKI